MSSFRVAPEAGTVLASLVYERRIVGMLTSTVTVISLSRRSAFVPWLVLGPRGLLGYWVNVGTIVTSSSVTTPSTMRNDRTSSASGSRVDTKR